MKSTPGPRTLKFKIPIRSGATAHLLALIGLTAIRAFAQNSVNADEQIVTQLSQFRADYTQSMLTGKPDVLLGYLADNVRLMPEFQLTVMGSKNASSYYSAFSARFQIQDYGRQKKEILDLGSRVVELGFFTTRMTLKSTHHEYVLKGKYQDIWERAENGKLTLITEAWNYSHPIDFADQLKFPEVPAVNIALSLISSSITRSGSSWRR